MARWHSQQGQAGQTSTSLFSSLSRRQKLRFSPSRGSVVTSVSRCTESKALCEENESHTVRSCELSGDNPGFSLFWGCHASSRLPCGSFWGNSLLFPNTQALPMKQLSTYSRGLNLFTQFAVLDNGQLNSEDFETWKM